MPSAQRRELKERMRLAGEQFLAYDFRPDLPSFFRLASVNVAMAGYNTTCELASTGKPAILVPRVQPRREQLLRARAFAARGLVNVLHPDELSAERLRAMVVALLAEGRRATSPDVDFAGLGRVTRRARKHLGIREAMSTSA